MAHAFLLPALGLYTLFFVAPALRAFYVSLFDWNGFTKSRNFIGLANFIELLSTPHFWQNVMKNTCMIAVVGGLAIFILALTLGGVLTTDVPAKGFLKNLVFFPTLLNPVAVAILWNYLYNPTHGLFNGILSFFGVINVPVWTSPGRLFWALLVAMVWMYTGYYFIIIHSALQRVPKELIESARLEGCGEFAIFCKIKLPLIMDVIQIMVVFWVINAIKEFTLFYAWGGGVAVPSADVQNIATYMHFIAFGKRTAVYRLGYATAMGVIMFLLTILTVLIVKKIFSRKESVEY